MARILEQAQRAAQRWEVAYTNFMSPPLAADVLAALAQLPDVAGVAWGGYPQAERVRVAMGREDVMLEPQQDASQLTDAVAALDCKGAAAGCSSRPGLVARAQMRARCSITGAIAAVSCICCCAR